MKIISALFPVAVGFLFAGAAHAAQIDLQRNVPVVIDGILYPISGVPLVYPNMEAVLAAFLTPQSEVNAVANLGDLSLVEVIVVDPMLVANTEAIDSARSENQRDIARLQEAITANVQLAADLESRSVKVEAVMAAEIAPDGVLVLYALA